MVTLRRRGVREFDHATARQQPVEVVGNHQEVFGQSEQFRVLLLHGDQLVQRVDFHELQAGVREDCLLRNLREGVCHQPGRPRVSITIGQPEHFVLSGHQDVIHAPRIDADGHDGVAVLRTGFGEPVQDAGPETHEIPSQRTGHRHRSIRESVNFVELDGIAVEPTSDDASALGSQVDGEINLLGHFESRSFRLVAAHSGVVTLRSTSVPSIS